MATSFDGDNALGVEYVGRPRPAGLHLDMGRSMSIYRLRKAGYTFGAIGAFHGISRQHAHRLYNGIPDFIRRRADRVLGDDHAEMG